MIKVLIVETTVFGYDGITNVITNYFTHINHREIQMDIVTVNPVDGSFKAVMAKYGRVNYVISCRNTNPLKYAFLLAGIAKKGRYQIIHVHGCSATMAVEMLAARLAGIKVRIAHSHNTKCDHVRIDKLLRPFFYKWYTHGFACGKEAGEWMFPGQDYEIVSNGVDINRFRYNPVTRDWMRNQYFLTGKTVIGHVGRFSIQKNHTKLLNIFEMFACQQPHAKLVMVGDGELRGDIENQAKVRNLDVFFVGISNEVENWLQAMDVMVFPSLFEGLPLGIVEAQAAGLPCILSDTISPEAAITDIVKFVPLEASDRQWANEILKFCRDYKRSQHYEKTEEQIKSKHFDIAQNCIDLQNMYRKILHVV